MDTTIINIPLSRWQEARDLRLEALQQDPLAFLSSYEDEVQFEDSLWINRLTSGREKNGNLTLYAECDGKLIGMLGANWSNRLKIQHIANVYSVYVTPSMRGQGIGSMMLQSLLDELKELPQIEKVKLTVTHTQVAAQELYQKFGFAVVGVAKKELKFDDTYYDEVQMEMFL